MCRLERMLWALKSLIKRQQLSKRQDIERRSQQPKKLETFFGDNQPLRGREQERSNTVAYSVVQIARASITFYK